MNKSKIDLIIHPVRLSLLQILTNACLTTSEISDALPSFPKSSIYRHLKILLNEGMVEIIETRPVKGTLEKVYRLAQPAALDKNDLQGTTKQDYMRMFTTFAASMLRGFSDFLDSTGDEQLTNEIFGCTATTFYATTQEMEQFSNELNKILDPLKQNSPSPVRQQQMFSIITFPVKKEDK